MREFLFVRHGQTEWNAQHKIMGREPLSLNDNGRRQAKRLAAFLAGVKIDAIISSPMKRAMETAEILLEGRKGLKLIIENGFTEIDFGEWNGLTYDEINSRYFELWKDYHERPQDIKIPGGEVMLKVRERTLHAFNDICGRFPSGRIVVVSHADVIKQTIFGVLGWPMNTARTMSLENCAVLLLKEHEFGFRLIGYNPSSFLKT